MKHKHILTGKERSLIPITPIAKERTEKKYFLSANYFDFILLLDILWLLNERMQGLSSIRSIIRDGNTEL